MLYHADCPDGFSGAWAAWKRFGDDAIYVPAYHSMPLPIDPTGREVYLIDFVYSDPRILKDLSENAERVVLLDHHVTAKPFLEQFSDYRFEIDHSGAVVAWKYFHPEQPVPLLLSYVEAVDLRRFNQAYVQEVDQLTSLYHYSFNEWDQLVSDFHDDQKREVHINTGRALLRKLEREIQKIVSLAEDIRFEGVRCKMANTPLHVSYVGKELCTKYPPMAIVWARRGNLVEVSLRSDGSIDVAKIAEKYGGGGHRDAAAFRWEVGRLVHFPRINQKTSRRTVHVGGS